MTWDNITVFQFQQIHALGQHADQRERLDISVDLVAICYGMTQQQVDSLPFKHLIELQNGLAFMNDVPSWNPVPHFEVDGRRYRFIYDLRDVRNVKELNAARYAEVKTFSASGFVEGLHRMAASMIVPQRRTWWGGWRDGEFNAGDHDQYAADVQAAPISAIHGSALFFCKVFAILMRSSADSLTQSLPTTMQQSVRQALILSSELMDGSTLSSGSPTSRESLLSKRIASRLSTSSTSSPF